MQAVNEYRNLTFCKKKDELLKMLDKVDVEFVN